MKHIYAIWIPPIIGGGDNIEQKHIPLPPSRKIFKYPWAYIQVINNKTLYLSLFF